MKPWPLVWSKSARYTPETALDGTVQDAVTDQLAQSVMPVGESRLQVGCVTAGKAVVGEVGISRAPSPPYQPSRKISTLYAAGELTWKLMVCPGCTLSDVMTPMMSPYA